jgi:hypothetical protein
MSLVFPSNPNPGDLFDGRWEWDGSKWLPAPPPPSGAWASLATFNVAGLLTFTVNNIVNDKIKIMWRQVTASGSFIPSIAYSTDNGATWTTPIQLSPNFIGATNQCIMSTLEGLTIGAVIHWGGANQSWQSAGYAAWSGSIGNGYYGLYVVGSRVNAIQIGRLSGSFTLSAGTLSVFGK